MRQKLKTILDFFSGAPEKNFHKSRILYLRSLGFIYVIAFLIILNQGEGLWSDQGLLPISNFTDAIQSYFGGELSAFLKFPSLFYWLDTNLAIPVMGYLGILGGVVLLLGHANFFILFTLWSLQLSFVNSGQVFYSYGWETLLLEMTFLSFFLVPFWKWNLNKTNFESPKIAIWALRWTLFRLMLGAGLIKIRGDSCWTDFSCLIYHYETQPNPHPLSYLFHLMPSSVHSAGVLFNHFVELIVPFGIFGPRRIRIMAAYIIAIFQTTLILSGNLAWLNWITLSLTLICLDDSHLKFIFKKLSTTHLPSTNIKRSITQKSVLMVLSVSLVILSYSPLANLLNSRQAMNTSYNQWHLINSYGAFGSISRERFNLVILGSRDGKEWKEYKFNCSSTLETDRPCFITPYHYHLDWQLWFSAMNEKIQEPWLARFAESLLNNNQKVLRLISTNPFPDEPPKFIKIDRYKMEFATQKHWPEKWWKKTFVNNYLPPSTLSP